MGLPDLDVEHTSDTLESPRHPSLTGQSRRTDSLGLAEERDAGAVERTP